MGSRRVTGQHRTSRLHEMILRGEKLPLLLSDHAECPSCGMTNCYHQRRIRLWLSKPLEVTEDATRAALAAEKNLKYRIRAKRRREDVQLKKEIQERTRK